MREQRAGQVEGCSGAARGGRRQQEVRVAAVEDRPSAGGDREQVVGADHAGHALGLADARASQADEFRIAGARGRLGQVGDRVAGRGRVLPGAGERVPGVQEPALPHGDQPSRPIGNRFRESGRVSGSRHSSEGGRRPGQREMVSSGRERPHHRHVATEPPGGRALRQRVTEPALQDPGPRLLSKPPHVVRLRPRPTCEDPRPARSAPPGIGATPGEHPGEQLPAGGRRLRIMQRLGDPGRDDDHVPGLVAPHATIHPCPLPQRRHDPRKPLPRVSTGTRVDPRPAERQQVDVDQLVVGDPPGERLVDPAHQGLAGAGRRVMVPGQRPGHDQRPDRRGRLHDRGHRAIRQPGGQAEHGPGDDQVAERRALR
ncbi:hypothetical protein [Actinoplanes missouriensis]|uniref:hypothetical protein n=1 Tax=Actinoplanes missouriensis TaxID=1866 RepID=UPI001E3EF717|nr:hypothetical protein [Actinoplanes missouriensis]